MLNGIDVSDFQGNSIDWASVKAAGYSFAIAKATEGTGNVQTSFAHNISGIRSARMIAGAYHFLSWQSDPAAQAAHFLSVYTPKNGDIPPTVDCEAVPAGMSSSPASTRSQVFCRRSNRISAARACSSTCRSRSRTTT